MNASITRPFAEAAAAATDWFEGRELRPGMTGGTTRGGAVDFTRPVGFLTTEFGYVEFTPEGRARIGEFDRDGRSTFSIATDAPPVTVHAATMIRDGYAKYGVHTLTCSACGEDDQTVVVDSMASTRDVDRLVALVAHAMHEHMGGADVLATVHHVVLTPNDVDRLTAS